MKVKVFKTPPKNDSNDVVFYDENDKQIGSGYTPKKNKVNKICILRCPECHKENYAVLVASGFCGWCGFSIFSDLEVKGEA